MPVPRRRLLATLLTGLALLLTPALAPLVGPATAAAAPAAGSVTEPPALTRTTVPARSSSYLCTGYDACRQAGYPHFGYKRASGEMYWRMYSGHNCTNYVAYRMVQNGMADERPWSGSGMAYHWGVAMADITDRTPRVGAVAWWERGSDWAPSSGHVAYVEKVISADEILVSEDSWGGDFHWRRVVRGTSGWPTGFIHFNDREVVAEAPPVITGTVEVGSQLVASAGAWRPAADPEFAWLVDGRPVPGATGTTYTPTPADRGRPITVQVTARRQGYASGTARATPATVRAGTMVATSTPTVSGKAEVDEVLQVDPGAYSPAPGTTRVKWFVDGERLRGVDEPRLALTQPLIGSTVEVRVVARAEGYRKVVSSTAPIGPVRAGTIDVTTPFGIDGRRRYGHVLEAVRGSFQPADADVAWTWLRDGEPVPGATGATYQLGAEDVGHEISLQALLTRDGYRDRLVEVPTGGRVTTRPTLDVRPVARRGRVVVHLRLTAPGVEAPSGEVTVGIGRQVVTGEIVDGRVRLVVRDLRPGTRTIRVHYAGTDVVEAVRSRTPVRVPRR